ncbi:MAG: lysine biosynthesis protein LysX [Candidatus Bipolaricaulia bacterium]
MIRLGMLFSRIRLEEKLVLREAARCPDVELVPIDGRKLTFDLGLGMHPGIDILLDREISQSRALYTLKLLHNTGVRTINKLKTVRICGDKVFTSKTLHNAGVPTPQVKVAFSPESALEAIEQMGYPVVLKPVDGSWGRFLAKIETRTAAEAILEHKANLGSYYHSIFYIQEYIDKPDRDIRAFVIGDEVVGAVYRKSDHWITNAARGGAAARYRMTDDLYRLCLKAAVAVGGEALAIDLMETQDGLTVHEINCAMEFKESLKALDVNLPACLIDYVVRSARAEAKV